MNFYLFIHSDHLYSASSTKLLEGSHLQYLRIPKGCFRSAIYATKYIHRKAIITTVWNLHWRHAIQVKILQNICK